MIHSLTENIGQIKHCNSLVHLFLWGANVFTLDSNEHYFRSRNLTLPQDSRFLRGSTRYLRTVPTFWTNMISPCSRLKMQTGGWRQYIPPKRLCLPTSLHCVKTQKTVDCRWLLWWGETAALGLLYYPRMIAMWTSEYTRSASNA
jgi:hypothetical protein